jgi:hypothetical protein
MFAAAERKPVLPALRSSSVGNLRTVDLRPLLPMRSWTGVAGNEAGLGSPRVDDADREDARVSSIGRWCGAPDDTFHAVHRVRHAVVGVANRVAAERVGEFAG